MSNAANNNWRGKACVYKRADESAGARDNMRLFTKHVTEGIVGGMKRGKRCVGQ